MQQPLISIIIPTYNRAHLIAETLDSVLAQTYSNWECIIVDDGSTDNTPEVLAAYCAKDTRFQYHKRPLERPKGANACRNYGIDNSLGKYFMFLDSDDLLATNCIEKRKQEALNNIDAKVLVFKMQRFKSIPGDQTKIINTFFSTQKEYLLNFLKYNLPWPITSLFLKRQVEFVKFNEELERLQDVEYSIKLLFKFDEIDFKIFKDVQPDCFYRASNTLRNSSTEFLKKIANSLLVYIKSVDNLINLHGNSKTNIYKKATVSFFISLYSFFLLPNIGKLFNEVKSIKQYLLKSGYISYGFFLKLTLLELLYKFNLNQIKGIGVYRLTKLWLKQ